MNFTGNKLNALDSKNRMRFSKRNTDLEELVKERESFYFSPEFNKDFRLYFAIPYSKLSLIWYENNPFGEIEQIDSNGRILIPHEVRGYLKTKSKIGYIGRGDFFTLCSENDFYNVLEKFAKDPAKEFPLKSDN